MVINGKLNSLKTRKIVFPEIELLLNIKHTMEKNKININPFNSNRMFVVINYSNGIIIPRNEFILLYEAFYMEDLIINSVNDKTLLDSINLSYKNEKTILEKYTTLLSTLVKICGLTIDVEKALIKYLTNNTIFRLSSNLFGKSADKISQIKNAEIDVSYYSEDGEDKNILPLLLIDTNDFKNNKEYKYFQCMIPEIKNGTVQRLKFICESADN